MLLVFKLHEESKQPSWQIPPARHQLWIHTRDEAPGWWIVENICEIPPRFIVRSLPYILLTDACKVDLTSQQTDDKATMRP